MDVTLLFRCSDCLLNFTNYNLVKNILASKWNMRIAIMIVWLKATVFRLSYRVRIFLTVEDPIRKVKIYDIFMVDGTKFMSLNRNRCSIESMD